MSISSSSSSARLWKNQQVVPWMENVFDKKKQSPLNLQVRERNQSIKTATEERIISSDESRNQDCFSCIQAVSYCIEPSSHDFSKNHDSRWNVQSLGPLPPFIERNNCIIYDLSPDTISMNISDCLRDLSILAQFDNEKALAKAETSDHVRFHIRLYNYYDRGTVVEIQRRSGDVITFSHVARSLLRSAQGLEIHDVPSQTSSQNHAGMNPATSEITEAIAMTLRKMASSPLLSGSTAEYRQSLLCCSPLGHSTKGGFLVALDRAAHLLRKDHLDANILGMESLRCLTNTNCTDYTSALAVARQVLCLHQADSYDSSTVTDDTSHASVNDDPSSSSDLSRHGQAGFSIIHDSVLSMIQHSKLRPSPHNSSQNTRKVEWEDMDDLEKDYLNTMHHYALSIFANSATLLRNSGELNSVIDTDESYENDVLPALIQELQKSLDDTTKLHHSYEAARILNQLLQVSKRCKDKARVLGAASIVHNMYIFGKERHSLLACELEGLSHLLDM